MKYKFKFTGTNIAAALLIIAYFLPWASSIISFSGFALTQLGVSPGVLSYVIGGLSRLVFVLLILIPVCAAIILYQNTTGDLKFSKYYKPAHILPAVLIIFLMVGAWFKMRSSISDSADAIYGGAFSQYIPKIETPGLFDVLSIGAYISLLASVYLLLVQMGKIKDREYFNAAHAEVNLNEPKEQKDFTLSSTLGS